MVFEEHDKLQVQLALSDGSVIWDPMYLNINHYSNDVFLPSSSSMHVNPTKPICKSSKGRCRSKEVRFLSLCWSRAAKAEPKNIVLKKISNRHYMPTVMTLLRLSGEILASWIY
ncbi:hypothetical protein P8452_74584 [Trifolium repens]|nr:hypothetical protein P8452_74584 [Trifolium repens]